MCTIVFAAAVVATMLDAGQAASPPTTHSIEFWHQIARGRYAVPAGNDVVGLSNELVGMLGSTDPLQRDEIAYSTLASWIYQTRVLTDAALRPLIERLLANLADGIGGRGDDRVFKRSFSALTLSVIVARDNEMPFLTGDEFRQIENAALDYLAREQDVRGYDESRGWIHSAAHTADLLKFLARSRYIDPAEQTRILDAISQKLAGVSDVFTHGEDERLARAILSIVDRADFDLGRFREWTLRVKPAGISGRPTEAGLRGMQNRKNTLAKLCVLLDAVDSPSSSVRAAHQSVLAALRGTF